MKKGIKAGGTARAVLVLRQLLQPLGFLALRAAVGVWRQPVTTLDHPETTEMDAIPGTTSLVHALDYPETTEMDAIPGADVGWTLMEVNIEDGFPLSLVFDTFEQDRSPLSLVFDTFEQAAAAYEGLVAMGVGNGLLVMKARVGTPAGRAGLMTGDYITHMNGNAVATRSEVCSVFESSTPGSLVEVEGMWLASALEVDDPDIKVFTPFKLSVRVPRSRS